MPRRQNACMQADDCTVEHQGSMPVAVDALILLYEVSHEVHSSDVASRGRQSAREAANACSQFHNALLLDRAQHSQHLQGQQPSDVLHSRADRAASCVPKQFDKRRRTAPCSETDSAQYLVRSLELPAWPAWESQANIGTDPCRRQHAASRSSELLLSLWYSGWSTTGQMHSADNGGYAYTGL